MFHDTTPPKICTKCKQSKPSTTEFFSRKKSAPGGLREQCKDCQRAYTRIYYAANKKRINQATREWTERNRERKKRTDRNWYLANKGRRKETVRAWLTTNRERDRERRRLYRGANLEKRKEYEQTWYIANSGRLKEHRRQYRAINKEKIDNQQRNWRLANPDKMRAKHMRRRALRENAEGSHGADDIKRQYDAQKGRCYYCRKKVGEKYHVDHVIPLARGGSNDPSNLVIACPSCNTSKQDKPPHEWPQGNHLL